MLFAKWLSYLVSYLGSFISPNHISTFGCFFSNRTIWHLSLQILYDSLISEFSYGNPAFHFTFYPTVMGFEFKYSKSIHSITCMLHIFSS